MNIVYLIGNGFDVKFNLKTKYSDFYKHAYTIKDSDPDEVKLLKQEIMTDIDSWADLEQALGRFTVNLKSLSAFETVFDDIRLNLASYISKQDKSFSASAQELSTFIEHLSRPVIFLTNKEVAEIGSFYKKINSSETSISIINFNYTTTIEKILNNNKQDIRVKNSINRAITIKNVIHIHGLTDSRFTLGVDRIEQIDNVSFQKNEDVIEAMVKPMYNSIGGHLEDDDCKNLINNANIICIYGMSLGDTDKTWWELIGERLLKTDTKLVLFWWENEEETTMIRTQLFADKRNRKIKSIKQLFLKQSALDKEHKDNKVLLDKIYIVYNEVRMFDIKFEQPEDILIKS